MIAGGNPKANFLYEQGAEGSRIKVSKYREGGLSITTSSIKIQGILRESLGNYGDRPAFKADLEVA